MNLNQQPSINELSLLFAARKDSLDSHVLWITNDGEVHIDPLHCQEQEFDRSRPNMRARLSTYRRGQGYVGKKAAADQVFMNSVLQTLKHEWIASQALADARLVERLY